jgi:UDP-N-acetylglucosamine acyltransferase
LSGVSGPINIHPSAIIAAGARIHPSCRIGPYCVIDDDVELGEGCELISHVVIHGPTKLGKHNRIFPFSAIGLEPQDYTFNPKDRVALEIGDHNIIRESVTISRGTIKGGGTTRIGSHTFIMAYSHVGHDCQLGDHVMLVNGATLAGHVIIEDWAVMGALGPVHQFVRIGAHSYIGGGTVITQDVLPFTKTVARREVSTFGVNSVGLERRGFSKERITKIQKAYKIFKRNNSSQALEKLKEAQLKQAPELAGEDVEMLIQFLEKSERGVIR